jgi:hypothetical protein
MPLVPTAEMPEDDKAEKRIRRLAYVAALARTAGDTGLPPLDGAVSRFLEGFVAPVQRWCLAHAEKVSACFISVDGEVLGVFVIGTGTGYDYSLGKPLSSLEMDLLRSGWPCNVLQLLADRPSGWCSFFRESEAIKVFPPGGPDDGFASGPAIVCSRSRETSEGKGFRLTTSATHDWL